MASNEWEWQERFTLEEQLRRIADNLISKRIEAWNRRQPEQVIVYIDLNDICEYLGIEKKDAYNLNKRLLRKLRKAKLV